MDESLNNDRPGVKSQAKMSSLQNSNNTTVEEYQKHKIVDKIVPEVKKNMDDLPSKINQQSELRQRKAVGKDKPKMDTFTESSPDDDDNGKENLCNSEKELSAKKIGDIEDQVPSVTKEYYVLLVLFTLLSFMTRFYRIEIPAHVW